MKKYFPMLMSLSMFIACLAAVSISIDDMAMGKEVRFPIVWLGVVTCILGVLYLNIFQKQTMKDEKGL
jgi:hypothetical protein